MWFWVKCSGGRAGRGWDGSRRASECGAWCMRTRRRRELQAANETSHACARCPQSLPPPSLRPPHLLAANVADAAAAVHILQEARRKGAQQLVAEEAEVVGGPGGRRGGQGVGGWVGGPQGGVGTQQDGGKQRVLCACRPCLAQQLAQRRQGPPGGASERRAGAQRAHMAGPSRAPASSSTRRKVPTYSLWSPACRGLGGGGVGRVNGRLEWSQAAWR